MCIVMLVIDNIQTFCCWGNPIHQMTLAETTTSVCFRTRKHCDQSHVQLTNHMFFFSIKAHHHTEILDIFGHP